MCGLRNEEGKAFTALDPVRTTQRDPLTHRNRSRAANYTLPTAFFVIFNEQALNFVQCVSQSVAVRSSA